MVALSQSFALLLLSSLVAANLGHQHPARHHNKRHALAHRATNSHTKSKRQTCKKRIPATSSTSGAAVVAVPDSATTGAATSSAAITSTSSKSTSAAASTPTVKPTTSFTSSSHSSGGSWWKGSGNAQKQVISHLLIGNTYSYTPSQWQSEIKMAAAQGIDGFALNLGLDSWQPDQVQAAYDAASASGTGFKMLFSFDMTVISCGDGGIITNNVKKFANHPAQLKDGSGAALVTTFDGGNCKSSGQWADELNAAGVKTRFAPTFFNDLTNTKLADLYPVVGGDTLWGGAWPKGDTPINWSEDAYRLSRNGLNRGAGDLYITTVSPWFFAHYPGKNFMWHVGDHLYASRWEDLYEHRDDVDIVEIVSWNDFGESTYIGPIGKDLPACQSWVDGYQHTAWLEMTGYYASAFKTGVWPTITADKIFIWGRPHGVNDNAPDGVGRPDRYTWVEDKLEAVLFSTGSGSLTLTQGSSSSTTQVKAGVNKIAIPLGVAQGVTATLARNGNTVFSFSPAIAFGHSPSTYNFNADVAAGP